MARLDARGEEFLSGLKRWGILGKVAAFALPAVLVLQFVGCSPPPTPPPPTPPAPIVVVDRFDPGPAAPTLTVPAPSPPATQAPPATTTPLPPAVTPPPTPTTPPEPPAAETPAVVEPAPVLSIAQMARAAVSDGLVSEAEVKVIAQHLDGGSASRDDYRAAMALYADARTTSEARGVLDVVFARLGVPAGAGATNMIATVERLAGRDALGPPLRGRLHTEHLMRLDVAPSSLLPSGGTIWSSPGARPQLFVELPAGGVFGPISLARPAS